MTADMPFDFPYEEVPGEPSGDALRRHWGIAHGLQAVDGLQTSAHLNGLSQENIDGVRTLEETGGMLRAYYAAMADAPAGDAGSARDESKQEADFVAFRIAEMLARGAFLFSPDMLRRIHVHIFQDLDPAKYRPGAYKDCALQKQELVLNGDSVVYADPSLVDATLKVAFEDELASSRGAGRSDGFVEGVARFVARLWQVHPFVEGNTRTVAVFAVLYLNDLGYDVTNEPFESHARYFRDALVRASYRNAKAGVFPDLSFLAKFLAQALGGPEEPLRPRDLMVAPLFDDPSLLRNVPAEKALAGSAEALKRENSYYG